jgi:hypothetical protein
MQTTYNLVPAAGRAGSKSSSTPWELIESCVASGAVPVGLLAVIAGGENPAVLTPTSVKTMPALTVDVDAFVTTHATAASDQNLATTDLNGVIGQARTTPARRVTFVANSHSDWDATRIRIEGLDVSGNPITEDLLMPNAGNTTLTTVMFFSQVTAVRVPAQTGTNGSYTVGISADEGVYSSADCGIVLRPSTTEPLTADSIATAIDCDWMKKGKCWVIVEAAVIAGDKVFVRTLLSGADLRGQFSGTSGTGFSPLPHAFFSSDGAQDGIAEITLM